MNGNKRTRGMICALAGGSLWGISGTISQYLFSHYAISSEFLTAVRMIFAGLLLLSASVIRRKPVFQVFKNRSNALLLLLFSVTGLMTVQYTYMKAISYSNSATATALQYLGQALILAVTCISLLRLPTKTEWAALLLALTGVFLLCTHGSFTSLALSSQALFWGIGSAVSLMIYTLLPRKLIRAYGSVAVTGWGMLIGGIVLAVSTRAFREIPALDLTGWCFVLFIVLFGTAAAFTLYLQGTADAGGVIASLLACTEPVCAAIFTTVWLKTPLVIWDYMAITLIIFMAVLLAAAGTSPKDLSRNTVIGNTGDPEDPMQQINAKNAAATIGDSINNSF